MELSGFVGQPCKSQVAFEFFPKKPLQLDLEKIAPLFEKAGFVLELETPVFLGLLAGNVSVSVFKNGKILVKDTKQKDVAQKIAQSVVLELKKV